MTTKATTVSVPGTKSMGRAFKKFAWGLGGGLGFLILYNLFGGLGIIAAPVIIGAAFKGDEGDDIAFLSGFLAIALGVMSGVSANNTNDNVNGLAV